jgi:hypothetical protein
VLLLLHYGMTVVLFCSSVELNEAMQALLDVVLQADCLNDFLLLMRSWSVLLLFTTSRLSHFLNIIIIIFQTVMT